jgi:hypothetical protein
MQRDVGYQFVVALSDAIEIATGAFAREDPTAFRYRGSDLRRAVERSLYINLVNNRALYDAFRDRREPDLDALGSPLERAVAVALLDPCGRVSSGRSMWRRLGARALWHARALRDGSPPRAGHSHNRPVAFMLDHLKFLRFVEPVRRRIGPAGEVIVSIVPPLSEALAAHGQDHVDLSRATDRPPVGRAVGVGLLGAPSLLSLYDGLLDAFASKSPRCVVVVEGMSASDELANRAARALAIATLCVQQGWSPFVHSGFRNMSYDAMAVWGEGFAELLAPHNPGQRFSAVGSFALAAEIAAGREALAEELDGRPAVTFFLQPLSPLIRDEHQRAMLDLARRAAAELPECRVLVREHPGWPLDDATRRELTDADIALVDPARFSLRPVLEVSLAAVSIYSTSLVEAAAMGCVPVIFNPTSMPRYSPDLDALEAGIEARTPDAALRAIARVVEDGDARGRLISGAERFRSQFFADDASPADATVRLIDELAARR